MLQQLVSENKAGDFGQSNHVRASHAAGVLVQLKDRSSLGPIVQS